MSYPEDAGSTPAAATVPILWFTAGRPTSRELPETEQVLRAIGRETVSWTTALRRIERRCDVGRTEAEGMLVRALRDPRRLLVGLFVRKTGNFHVRLSPAPAVRTPSEAP